jgi:ankyrin repeat protein
MSDPVKAHLRSSKSRKKRAHQNESIFHQNCALHRDAVTGDLFSIDQLLRSKCNVDEVNKAGSSGLHFAAQNGNTDVAIKLLVANANPSLCNKFNETPLHLAVKKGFDEVAYHLLRNNSAVDVANTTDAATPLYYAVTKGYSECVRLLVRAGANPHFVITTTGESILQLACNGTNVETMRQITEVVNVNATLQNGRTALHWACYYGKMAFVRQLLHRGASVHVVDEEGCTPLFWAVYSGHANVVRALLRHGADTEAKAADGSRPIHWAATYDHPTICEMLLMDNCNVNAMYNYGMTALHHAAELGFDQIVTVLLAHGADVNLRVQDRTVQELAADKQHKRVLQLLDDADKLIAERKLTFIPLAQLTVEQIAGFLNTKHLTMFVDKFADLQIDGKKASEVWSSRSNAGVFMQSIAKDTVKRFKTLCQQGMYVLHISC